LTPGTAAVLRTLAGTRSILTGRTVAELSGLSQYGALKVLHTLTDSGIVHREPAGRSALFRLNRSHLLTAPLLTILAAESELRRRLSEEIAGWKVQPTHVSLFGSVARGTATTTSDIDLLVVRPTTVAYDDEVWRSQLGGLTQAALMWTGQAIAWLELSDEEMAVAVAATERIVTEWRRDGVRLAGSELDDLLRTGATPR